MVSLSKPSWENYAVAQESDNDKADRTDKADAT